MVATRLTITEGPFATIVRPRSDHPFFVISNSSVTGITETGTKSGMEESYVMHSPPTLKDYGAN